MVYWPSPTASVACQQTAPQLPALVLFLDGIQLAIELPPFPDGRHMLGRFCRELARKAVRLADTVDPDGARHRLMGDQR
jgi:hypothetical protein